MARRLAADRSDCTPIDDTIPIPTATTSPALTSRLAVLPARVAWQAAIWCPTCHGIRWAIFLFWNPYRAHRSVALEAVRRATAAVATRFVMRPKDRQRTEWRNQVIVTAPDPRILTDERG